MAEIVQVCRECGADEPKLVLGQLDRVPGRSVSDGTLPSAGRPGQREGRLFELGFGATDVAAPGGNGTTGNCLDTVLSTIPVAWGCFQGTSMASPHAAGVAALIVSEFGYLGADGDWKLSPTKVEQYLQNTTVDIGEPGYDECFGNGRIDALRAVMHDTSRVYEPVACTEPD